jgi:hypothetical protein
MIDQEIIFTLATKVMGWVELDSVFYEEAKAYPAFYFSESVICGVVEKTPDRYIDYVWNPLQNIADAWMLMDKLKQRCFCEVAMTETDDGYWHWMARFIEVHDSPYRVNTFKAVEKDAPRAISMAAYKLAA